MPSRRERRRRDRDLLLFADADVFYDPRALPEMVALLETSRLDLLFVVPRIEARGFWENVLMPNLVVTFFGGPAFLVARPARGGVARGRREPGTSSAARPTKRVGGHAALRDSVIDDLRLGHAFKRAGYRIARGPGGRSRAREDVPRLSRKSSTASRRTRHTSFRVATGGVLFLLTAATLLLAVLAGGRPARRRGGSGVPRADLLLAGAALGLVILSRVIASPPPSPIRSGRPRRTL